VNRFQAKPIRPTPYITALQIELVALLKREGDTNIGDAMRWMGLSSNPPLFNRILQSLIRKGRVERTGDTLSLR